MTFKQLKEENYRYVVIKVNNEKEESKVLNYKYIWLDLCKAKEWSFYYPNVKQGEYLIFETDKNWQNSWDMYHKIFKPTITLTTVIKYNKEVQ